MDVKNKQKKNWDLLISERKYIQIFKAAVKKHSIL